MNLHRDILITPETLNPGWPAERWEFDSKDLANYEPMTNLERRQLWERRYKAYRDQLGWAGEGRVAE